MDQKHQRFICTEFQLGSLKVDRQEFMVAGVIAEKGTHEALLHQSGLYEQLWSKQTHGGDI